MINNKDILEELVWKILSSSGDQDDIRGYIIQAAAHGVSLGRTDGLELAAKAMERSMDYVSADRIRALKEEYV